MKVLKVSFPVLLSRRQMLDQDSNGSVLKSFLCGGAIPDCVLALVKFQRSGKNREELFFNNDGSPYRGGRPIAIIRKMIAEAKNDEAQNLRKSLQRLELNHGKNRTRQRRASFLNAAVKFFRSGASQEEAVALLEEAIVQATHDS